jgi:hypothetical protein
VRCFTSASRWARDSASMVLVQMSHSRVAERVRAESWLRATPTPIQAMQRTASKPATAVWCVCHPPFGCVAGRSGLAVADLVSR